VRNTILQEHVRKGLGQELRLTLDVKTRCSSLIKMIERLLQLKSFIQQAVMDIGNEDIYNESDFKSLTDILKVLKPTELAVKELSKKSSTLLICECVLKFLFKTLEKQSTDLSESLLSKLTIINCAKSIMKRNFLVDRYKLSRRW
jgi:uncharacterized protein (UPF0335 family)